MRLVLDTSVFIAREARRPLSDLPDDAELAISVVTLAELRTGVLTASDEARRTRLATYDAASTFGALPIDRAVADRFADLAHAAITAGRKPRVQDLWIAATAAVHQAAVATQDGDYDDLPGIEVVKV
jgi:predicted nucleic acid-binding protein